MYAHMKFMVRKWYLHPNGVRCSNLSSVHHPGCCHTNQHVMNIIIIIKVSSCTECAMNLINVYGAMNAYSHKKLSKFCHGCRVNYL